MHTLQHLRNCLQWFRHARCIRRPPASHKSMYFSAFNKYAGSNVRHFSVHTGFTRARNLLPYSRACTALPASEIRRRFQGVREMEIAGLFVVIRRASPPRAFSRWQYQAVPPPPISYSVVSVLQQIDRDCCVRLNQLRVLSPSRSAFSTLKVEIRGSVHYGGRKRSYAAKTATELLLLSVSRWRRTIW